MKLYIFLVLCSFSSITSAGEYSIKFSYTDLPCKSGPSWSGDICTTYQAGTGALSTKGEMGEILYQGHSFQMICRTDFVSGGKEQTCQGDEATVIIRPHENVFYVTLKYQDKLLYGRKEF